MFEKLAKQLEANHYVNRNGCRLTDYSKIRGLTLLATSTNGTSGIGVFQGKRVYWYRTSGKLWDNEKHCSVDDIQPPHFEIEPA